MQAEAWIAEQSLAGRTGRLFLAVPPVRGERDMSVPHLLQELGSSDCLVKHLPP